METQLLRVSSHRAREKLERTGVLFNELASFYDGHYYEVLLSDLPVVLIIKGISKARKPKSDLSLCWSFSKTYSELLKINPSNFITR